MTIETEHADEERQYNDEPFYELGVDIDVPDCGGRTCKVSLLKRDGSRRLFLRCSSAPLTVGGPCGSCHVVRVGRYASAKMAKADLRALFVCWCLKVPTEWNHKLWKSFKAYYCLYATAGPVETTDNRMYIVR